MGRANRLLIAKSLITAAALAGVLAFSLPAMAQTATAPAPAENAAPTPDNNINPTPHPGAKNAANPVKIQCMSGKRRMRRGGHPAQRALPAGRSSADRCAELI